MVDKKRVAVFLADGFEEVEATTIIDLLRRADVDVATFSLNQHQSVKGAHGITVLADQVFSVDEARDLDAYILPGGMPGTQHLSDHHQLAQLLIEQANRQQVWFGAICAAPSVLGELGLLKGHKATCYPGFERSLLGAEIIDQNVVVSPPFITSKGPATAIPFALALIANLCSPQRSKQVEQQVLWSQ